MFNATVYTVLIASPHDVQEEREALPQVIHRWTDLNASAEGVVLLPVMWETHAVPELGGRPQEILNRQIVDSADILIGAFWTRIGTATGDAVSGTAEEIREFRDSGRPVLLYFSSRPAAPDSVDLEQLAGLREFKAEVQQDGIYSEYTDLNQLERLVSDHLTRVVRGLPRGDDDGDAERVEHRGLAGDLLAAIERIHAEWRAELNSQPGSTQEGKLILRRLGDAWMDVRQAYGRELEPEALAQIDRLSADSRSIQRHQTYLDGGLSFREFWQLGDAIVEMSAQLTKGLVDA